MCDATVIKFSSLPQTVTGSDRTEPVTVTATCTENAVSKQSGMTILPKDPSETMPFRSPSWVLLEFGEMEPCCWRVRVQGWLRI